jgi:GTPase
MEFEIKKIHSIIDILYIPSESKLIPESDQGNIEYKLRLDKKGISSRENMVSQMLYRMNEGRNKYGRYEADYIIGISDDGSFSDLPEQILINSVNILRGGVKKANAKIISEKTYVFPGNKMIIHVVIRKDHKERYVNETNIMILGPSGIGKSSLMGRITHGQKDDGKGFTRKLVLRHAHEKSSGATSCLKYDTIGFSGKNIMNYSIGIEFNMENIYSSSDRLVNLIDIPGDFVSFSKTIMYSVSCIRPDNIIICIPSYDPITHLNAFEFVKNNSDIYKFIISTCIVYDIDPIIVITKQELIDVNGLTVLQPEINKQIGELFNLWVNELRSDNIPSDIGFSCAEIKEISDNVSDMFSTDRLTDNSIVSETKTNDFCKLDFIEVSTITDYGYDKLISKLCDISNNNIIKQDKMIKDKMLKDKMFVVNDVFTIPDTGTIFHGILKYGVINIDDVVDILCHGIITKHRIKSIHRKTLDVDRLLSGESGSITFYDKIEKIDKTSVIIGEYWINLLITKTRIMPIFDNIKLKPQQYSLFVGNNIIACNIEKVDGDDLNQIFELNSYNELKFIIDTDIGILKDEKQNYFFIKFI